MGSSPPLTIVLKNARQVSVRKQINYRIEKVIYFSSYIITKVREKEKESILEKVEEEFEKKSGKIEKQIEEGGKESSLKKELKELKKVKRKTEKEIKSIERLTILSEAEYRKFSLKYG